MGERYEVRENTDRWMGKCWSVFDTRRNEFVGGNFAHTLRVAAEQTAARMNKEDGE